MPAIVLKAQTGTTKSRREGNTTIIEKTVEKGLLTESHTDPGRRLKGKQAAKQTVTFSAAEMKAFDKSNDEKIEKGRKAATAKTLASMNAQANKYGGMLEANHRAAMKLLADKLERAEAELAAMVGAQRDKKERKEERKRAAP